MGYIPFLLIGYQKSIAEIIAIYVYYFLVAGVGLEIVEYIRKIEPKVDFEKVGKALLFRINWITLVIVFGIITTIIVIANRFYPLELWKWTFVYLFTVSLVFYWTCELIKKSSILK